jgi:hypothetical protein
MDPDGWCSVEELIQCGFANARVVMANEAHSGLRRCVRTREVGVRMVHAAHRAGVRRLAMEALPRLADGSPGPIRAIPPSNGGYLGQPDMRRLIRTALDLGWTLWAYEAAIEPGKDPAELISTEFTNWREREQARNLCRLTTDVPAEPLLVWCGNGHAIKQAVGEWTPMGVHFTAMSDREPFVITQIATIDFAGTGPEPWVRKLLAATSEVLASHGGTAGILRDQAPAPLNDQFGIDAVIISEQNSLT